MIMAMPVMTAVASHAVQFCPKFPTAPFAPRPGLLAGRSAAEPVDRPTVAAGFKFAAPPTVMGLPADGPDAARQLQTGND
jgi:hypothetical protein